MEDLQIQVLSGFGLKAKKIVKERNGYICNTQKGFVLIQKTAESCEHIAFSHSVKEYLHNAGFPNTDRYLLSTKDKPFVLLETDTYVATPWPDFTEINFESNEEFTKALREVALMHNLSREMKVNPRFYQELDLPGTFSKKLGELHAIKKRVGIKKRLSDFDVLFLKNYSYYESQLLDALAQLDHISTELNGSFLCHNELKEASLPIVDQQVHIKNFSHCCFMNASITDFSDMICRYIKKLPQNPIHIQDMLEIYLKINKLSPTEIRMLCSLLLYPEKFLKLCSHYYSKKRTWIPNAMISRMENLILGREKALQYIEGLK